MRIDDLALFPLSVVLFPGQLLPLHIFEERYKLMISKCLQDDPRFGVVLISEGREVGGPTKIHTVGGIARIIKVGRYDDGRMDLMTVGVQRFRILKTNSELPYLRASVELLNDLPEEPETLQAQASRVMSLLGEYQKVLKDDEEDSPDFPAEAEALSYIAGVLDFPRDRKQTLLESQSTSERLRQVEAFLKHEIQMIKILGPSRPLQHPDLGSFS